jgi:hypothetical protein
MTEPGLPVPIEEQEDTFLRNIHRLFFRPKVYFEGIVSPKKSGWLFVFALSYGLAGAVSRAGLGGPVGAVYAPSWTLHWAGIFVGGFVGMLIAYYLGGAWYRLRLAACGARDVDWKLVRLVYLSAAQVLALPIIVLELVSTVLFPKPAAAAAGLPLWLALLASVFNFWSYHASYVGARTVFKVPKLRAAIWFLVMPASFLIMVSVAVFVWLIPSLTEPSASPGPPVPKAEVSEPLRFSDLDMAFSYPGNWSVTESGQSPGVVAKVEIQGQGGPYLLVQRIEAKDSAEAVLENWLGTMRETISPVTRPEPFDAWGTLKGAGLRLEVQSRGDP